MKLIKNLAMSIIAAGIFSACGGSKQAATTTKSNVVQESYQELDRCEKYALQKPGSRAVGEGYDYRVSYAKTYAEGQARAEMRRKIEAAILSASSEDGDGYEKHASSGNEGASVRDEGAKKNIATTQIAEGIVKNTAVVEMSKYVRNDGSYHVYVCIEYMDGISKMAENIAKQVEQQVSDDERMKMNFEFEKFRERIENELKKQK
ncbi:MAG: hypothetical protein Q4F50_02020 [Bacteroides sp.]|uniref:hypothetical protein n=1 Tax=Bacteroides sp. TaxID=29523 RepID=UPI0026E10536|nr:hypothetical protein [Bacteroides sp.]MDO5418831.1 hypothetical protein [Bacteroides sp.]